MNVQDPDTNSAVVFQLHAAVEEGQFALLDALLSGNSIDIDERNRDGCTALYMDTHAWINQQHFFYTTIILKVLQAKVLQVETHPHKFLEMRIR